MSNQIFSNFSPCFARNLMDQSPAPLTKQYSFGQSALDSGTSPFLWSSGKQDYLVLFKSPSNQKKTPISSKFTMS